jgi:lysozyme
MMLVPKQNIAIILILIGFAVICNSSCKRKKTSEKSPVIPPGYQVHGIDVSHHQNHVNWEIVSKQKNIKFAFMKATEGISLTDRKFKTNWKGSKSNKIKRGAYHFFRPQFSGYEQAKFYLSVVDFDSGDLYPVLDLEVGPKTSIDLFYKEIDAWLKTVELATGKKPILYASRKFYTSYLEKRYPKHHLWVANYNTLRNPLKGKWKFWQHTEEAKIPGISGRVDHNVFNGSENDLLAISF